MKVYTGGGDKGKTSLFSGERIPKNHARVEAYGAIDELNAVLGMLTSVIQPEQDDLIDEIRMIQADLFAAGALLATSPDSPSFAALPPFDPGKACALETAIDRMELSLPRLKSFVLPGGQISSAWAHIARTVCRRAERRIVSLSPESRQDELPEALKPVAVYVNRLSDYLFVLARYCNRIAGAEDIRWE